MLECVNLVLSGAAHSIYDSNIACQLVKPTNFVTRRHYLRLFKRHFHYDLRNYYFGNRIISHWNSLPDNVINSILEFLKIHWIFFGKVKIVIIITNPTYRWYCYDIVGYNFFTFFYVFVVYFDVHLCENRGSSLILLFFVLFV